MAWRGAVQSTDRSATQRGQIDLLALVRPVVVVSLGEHIPVRAEPCEYTSWHARMRKYTFSFDLGVGQDACME